MQLRRLQLRLFILIRGHSSTGWDPSSRNSRIIQRNSLTLVLYITITLSVDADSSRARVTPLTSPKTFKEKQHEIRSLNDLAGCDRALYGGVRAVGRAKILRQIEKPGGRLGRSGDRDTSATRHEY